NSLSDAGERIALRRQARYGSAFPLSPFPPEGSERGGDLFPQRAPADPRTFDTRTAAPVSAGTSPESIRPEVMLGQRFVRQREAPAMRAQVARRRHVHVRRVGEGSEQGRRDRVVRRVYMGG